MISSVQGMHWGKLILILQI